MTDRLVLVVDDDPTTRDVLRRYLTRSGHRVAEAVDGATALDMVSRLPVDLVVLDLMLPGVDGLDVCARLRANTATRRLPILMLTALGSESDRVVGLEQGADDYVVKPFSPREVTLRVGRLLERAEPPAPDLSPVVDGDLRLDPRGRSAERAGRTLGLTSREFDLLAFLLAHPRQAFTRTELLRSVWDWDFGDESTVTVHVRRLREKVESDPSNPIRLRTVWGTGYRWEPSEGSDP